MKLRFACGCGFKSYNFQDWISHTNFKYRSFCSIIKSLLLTKIVIQ